MHRESHRYVITTTSRVTPPFPPLPPRAPFGLHAAPFSRGKVVVWFFFAGIRIQGCSRDRVCRAGIWIMLLEQRTRRRGGGHEDGEEGL